MKIFLLLSFAVFFAVFSVIVLSRSKKMKREKIELMRRNDYTIYKLGWKRGQLAGDASFTADSIYFTKILTEIYEKESEE